MVIFDKNRQQRTYPHGQIDPLPPKTNHSFRGTLIRCIRQSNFMQRLHIYDSPGLSDCSHQKPSRYISYFGFTSLGKSTKSTCYLPSIKIPRQKNFVQLIIEQEKQKEKQCATKRKIDKIFNKTIKRTHRMEINVQKRYKHTPNIKRNFNRPLMNR